MVAFGIARQLGGPQLAVQAMDRGLAAAVRLGDPALAGFAGLARASSFSRLGVRRTALAVLAEARAAVEPEADPTGEDVRVAEAPCGEATASIRPSRTSAEISGLSPW